MGITRIVETNVTCDVCGEWIIGWSSANHGVSKDWARYYARKRGATATSKRVVCKECRIKERIKECSLIKKLGKPWQPYGKCKGFDMCGMCKRCIANVDFDWEKCEKNEEE